MTWQPFALVGVLALHSACGRHVRDFRFDEHGPWKTSKRKRKLILMIVVEVAMCHEVMVVVVAVVVAVAVCHMPGATCHTMMPHFLISSF